MSFAHGITLKLENAEITLRPALRAAMTLEKSHQGLPNLFEKVQQLHLGTIREIILACAPKQDAEPFLEHMAQQPIRKIQQVQLPIAELVAQLVPAGDDKKTTSPKTAKPMPWSEAYRELFKLATGWLHWTPETAWNATPSEIDIALTGHMEMLKAIHGSSEEEDRTQVSTLTETELAEIERLGFDPAFDRSGLRSLAAKHGGPV